VRSKFGRLLIIAHYRILKILLQKTSPEARAWHEQEAQKQAWLVRAYFIRETAGGEKSTIKYRNKIKLISKEVREYGQYYCRDLGL
jgi:hypothetical protein